jgi:hypothetical protein
MLAAELRQAERVAISSFTGSGKPRKRASHGKNIPFLG